MMPWLCVLDEPRFVGLWTYRHGKRQFCASVMINGVVHETDMHASWEDALSEAADLLSETAT